MTPVLAYIEYKDMRQLHYELVWGTPMTEMGIAKYSTHELRHPAQFSNELYFSLPHVGVGCGAPERFMTDQYSLTNRV